MYNTSVMIYHCEVSLSKQHTDLLICHCTKQDLSHTSRYVFIILKFKCAYLKIYGKWLVHAGTQANIHTHVCNEIMLVWGSLRLAPIM